jgi:hypothetical protein
LADRPAVVFLAADPDLDADPVLVAATRTL